jgi:hypothetical protein
MFVLFFGLWAAGLYLWVASLIEIVRATDDQFRLAQTEKVTWVIVVALAGVIGALIWRFTKRSAVLAAAGRVLGPAPGWFPEPGSHALRWWDGARWTEHRHQPPSSIP